MANSLAFLILLSCTKPETAETIYKQNVIHVYDVEQTSAVTTKSPVAQSDSAKSD